MTKKILLPTDFSIESLIVLKTYLQKNNLNQNDNYDITLLHGYSIDAYSIHDLLFFSKSKILKDLKLNNYLEGVDILKNKFDTKLKSVKIDILPSYSVTDLDNYLIENQIEEVITCNRFKFKSITKRSHDLNKIIPKSRCKIPVIKMNLESSEVQNVHIQDLAVLFSPTS